MPGSSRAQGNKKRPEGVRPKELPPPLLEVLRNVRPTPQLRCFRFCPRGQVLSQGAPVTDKTEVRGLRAGGPSMALRQCFPVKIHLTASSSFALKAYCPLSPPISGLHPWDCFPLTRQVRADNVQAHGDCLVDFLRREESVSGPAFSWQHVVLPVFAAFPY